MKKQFKKIIAATSAMSTLMAALSCFTANAAIEPNPVISRNCPSYSGSGDAKSANDEHYFSFCFMTSPDYLAYDLSNVPDSEKKQVLAVWYNTSAFDNIGNYANRNMEPSDYTIEVNTADGGEYPTDGWEIVETVTENTLSSRQHLISMKGYNWIRLNISKADGQEGKTASINFDIHSAPNGVSDSWLFLGDSITAGGMNNCYRTGFATHINMIDSKYFPVQENGGIGGILSSDGKANIDRWLSVSHAKYISIAYGTNDCWGKDYLTQEYYDNTKYMIDAILYAGKIPVLPKIPASTNDDVKDNVPLYNAMIDKLYEEYGDKLVKGPDFQSFFEEHPDYLSGDGVHPSDVGYAAMRETWANCMYENVYKASAPDYPSTSTTTATTETSTTTTTSTETTENVSKNIGDANCDGKVEIADATLILQYLTNKDDYKLTEQGMINADCCNVGDGVTAQDALAIQKLDAGVIKNLPANNLD